MAATRQWLETKPDAADKIKDGPAEFQLRWKDVRERLNAGGHVCDGVSALDKQGLHAVSASGVASPDIHKSDMVTKIISWADGLGTILADYPFTGSKNFPGSMLMDGAVGVDASGYLRGIEALRCFESSPADAKVNIKPGVFFQGSGGPRAPALYPGGFLTLGVGDLTKPAVGNHANYVMFLDSSGVLSASKGADALYAATPVTPSLAIASQTPLAIIRIRQDSAIFTVLPSSPNAYLFQEGRCFLSRNT